MTDMPEALASTDALDAWVKRHKIEPKIRANVLPLLRSNLREFHKIPLDERNAGVRKTHGELVIGQFNIVQGAATPRG